MIYRDYNDIWMKYDQIWKSKILKLVEIKRKVEKKLVKQENIEELINNLGIKLK